MVYIFALAFRLFSSTNPNFSAAGLLLCSDLTESSVELQKLVAFENAFDRVFRLIEAEGSLLQGGIIVQDCLSLLANLIRGNTSNQSLFRESGCVKKILEILPGGLRDGTPRDRHEDGDFENPQKGKNIWGLLTVVRMFFVQGSVSSRPNSDSFQKHGFLQRALDLAFSTKWEGPIRAEVRPFYLVQMLKPAKCLSGTSHLCGYDPW